MNGTYISAFAHSTVIELSQESKVLFEMLGEFAENCVTVGKDVRVLRGGEERLAHADGIGPDAALLVTYADGTQEAVSSGELSVRGMYGYL